MKNFVLFYGTGAGLKRLEAEAETLFDAMSLLKSYAPECSHVIAFEVVE